MTNFDKGHALVIGVGEYDLPALRTPKTGPNGMRITVSDAQGVADVLKDPNVCAYPPEQVTFLSDDQTTRAGVTAALQQLAQSTRPDDTVVIFFCGHGALGDDGEYYFGTRDVQLSGNKFKAGTGLSKTELLDLLRAFKSQKLLLIINACFSGNIGATLGPPEESQVLGTPPSQELRIQVLGTGEGRAIITASRSTQYSCFDPTQPRTFFGQALFDALHGKGLPGNEYIGLYEMYNAVYQSVHAAATRIAREQEPVLTIVEEVGPFPVALSAGGAPGATLGIPEPIQQVAPRGTAVELIPRDQVAKAIGQNAQAYNLSAGGDAVIHGNIVHGDQIQGDNVGGDKIGGDKISVGNITNAKGVAIGRGARATVTEGISVHDLNALFQSVYQKIDARPEDPNVGKDEIVDKVRRVEQEAAKGNAANPSMVERWLGDLRNMAPDILEVTAAALLNPVAGVATAILKVAQMARQP